VVAEGRFSSHASVLIAFSTTRADTNIQNTSDV
jgi:hypothetical protein